MTSQTPENTLSKFLTETKTAYLEAVKSGKGHEWTVVMGNEAGDLDSLASAVAFAWYEAKVRGLELVVPMTQTPQTELHLRAENAYALEVSQLGVDADILCIDEIPQSTPFPSRRFALVDHNRLQARFLRDNPDATVVAVIDHHEDEGLYKDTADPRIIVVPTGSCASLVAGLFEEHVDVLTPELATLLMTAILIDTNGLKEGGKAKDADIRAAYLLIPRSPALQVEGALQNIYKALDEKKSSVDHLSTYELLQRDYKEYALSPASASAAGEILMGLSSVPTGFASWLPRHPQFFAQTEKFMTDRGLVVLGILTSFRDSEKLNQHGKGKHRREQMYVVRDNEELAGELFDALEKVEELKLKRVKFTDYGVHNGFGEGFKARVWKQKNTDATRKVTAPIVKGIIEGRPNVSNL
ncbi:DHH phosphoesterase [Trametes polyzona]|nr:DHH phosphoesterase [Trametes polyzona]